MDEHQPACLLLIFAMVKQHPGTRTISALKMEICISSQHSNALYFLITGIQNRGMKIKSLEKIPLFF